MDLRELQAFLAVAEELNFRAAAERLNMTQPPLTRIISKLEDEIGVQLFLRDTRKVELTPSGLTLLKDARDILGRVEQAKFAVQKSQNLKRGQLKVGLSNAAFYSGAMKAIWKFKESFPQIKVEIIDAVPSDQISKLRKGSLDVAILEAPIGQHDEFNFFMLDQEALGVLVPLHHKLSSRKRIRLSDLDDETLIMHDRKEREGFYDALINLFKRSGVKIHVHLRQKDQSCVKLVALGEGVLLTTKAMSAFGTPHSKFIELDDDLARLSVGAFWAKEEPSPALTSLLSFLENQGYIIAPKSPCLMSLANW